MLSARTSVKTKQNNNNKENTSWKNNSETSGNSPSGSEEEHPALREKTPAWGRVPSAQAGSPRCSPSPLARLTCPQALKSSRGNLPLCWPRGALCTRTPDEQPVLSGGLGDSADPLHLGRTASTFRGGLWHRKGHTDNWGLNARRQKQIHEASEAESPCASMTQGY